MQYYVIAPDGQKYGPADVPTLAQWAAEGRINPDTMLESAQDASRVPASNVPGIIAVAQSNPYAGQAQPTAFTTYQRPTGGYTGGDDGQSDINKAWIFTALGFVCGCFPLSIAGIIFANNAKQKGNPGAQAPFIASIIVLVLNVFGGFFWFGNIMSFMRR